MKMSKKDFIISAIFPMLITIVASYMIYYIIDFSRFHPMPTELLISVIISFVTGGALPIILILIMKINTSKYFLKQLIVYAVSLAAWVLPCVVLYPFILASSLIVLIPLLGLIVTVFVFKEWAAAGERA